MRYPIIIHKDADSDYGVTVPDLPGCFSAGDSFDEALVMAKEAIECHIEGLMNDGETLPLPKRIEAHQANRAFKGGVWALVEIDISKLSGNSKRVNITLPERILSKVDGFASRTGDSRSGLLAQAALEYVASHSEEID